MQQQTPNSVETYGWRLERSPVDGQFIVTRNGQDGQECVRSASGRVSTFQTMKGAQCALRAAIAQSRREAAAQPSAQ